MRDYRGVEQGRGLKGVLLGEAGTDKLLLIVGNFDIGRDPTPDIFKMPEKYRSYIGIGEVETLINIFDNFLPLFVGGREYPEQDMFHLRAVSRHKRTDKRSGRRRDYLYRKFFYIDHTVSYLLLLLR
ncbi:hypothetical protein FQZ97_1068290 [compost metagenome]